MHNLRSTFPLDETAITRAALGQVFADPITWVPLLPVVAAYTIFSVPEPVCFGLGGLVVAGLAGYWRLRWHGIEEGLRRAMIREHNEAQNSALQESATLMRGNGAGAEAEQMEKFIELKAKVERRLHGGGLLTEQRMQLDQLVDSLCFGVRDQLCALAGLERSEIPVLRANAQSQVAAAFTTLTATVEELDTILGPSAPALTSPDASLEEVMRRLREEAEIARRVQARLQEPMNATFSAETRLSD